MAYSWAYGVTTVAARRANLLPRTLASLRGAGFDRPFLFADGVTHSVAAEYEKEFNLPVVNRIPLPEQPFIRVFMNWCLALGELYGRNPYADRFAVFQDDTVCLKNLRAYLDACPMQPKTYWNCLTFPTWRRKPGNQERFPRVGQTARFYEGWYPSNQKGWGAVALVFSNEAARTLLAHTHMIDRPRHAKRGHRFVDGGIVESMHKSGYRELVHNPSLVFHCGRESTIRREVGSFPDATSWRGENYDALELLNYPDRLGTV